jgi:hypothetical protein
MCKNYKDERLGLFKILELRFRIFCKQTKKQQSSLDFKVYYSDQIFDFIYLFVFMFIFECTNFRKY